MKQWTLKLSPGEYLFRYPKGPNAELAGELLEIQKLDYDQNLAEQIRLSRIAIRQLARYFGSSVIDREEGEKTVHPFLERTISSLIRFPMEETWWKYPIHQRKCLCLRRKMIQKYGLHFETSGELGAPMEFPVKPDYWTLKQEPARYLQRSKDSSNTRNWYLAQAAVAQFEKMIEF